LNWLNFTSDISLDFIISLKHRFELLLQHICHDGFLSCNQTDPLESNFVLNCTIVSFRTVLCDKKYHIDSVKKVGDWICSRLCCFIYDHVYGLFYEYEERWVIEFAAVLWLNSCTVIWYVPMCMDVPVMIGWIHFQTLTVSIFFKFINLLLVLLGIFVYTFITICF
jgi:hypothetical protein